MPEVIARFASLPSYGLGGLALLLLYALQSEIRFGGRARTIRAGKSDRMSTLVVSLSAIVSVLGFVAAMKASSPLIQRALPSWIRHALMPGLPAVAWLGVAIGGCGLALRLWAVLTLRERYTRTLLVHSEHLVERGGPYRRVRHPGYLGSLLCLNGLALASGNAVVFLASLVATCAAYGYRIRIEDAMLVRELGPSYAQYRREVGALLPVRRAPGVDRSRPDTWGHGSSYEQYCGRWSRRVAPPFLSWLSIPAGRGWLDVGCGTGGLCAAIVDRCSPGSVVGVEPSEGFLESARKNLAERVELHQGTATAIPLADRSVDVVVSGLVLNFIPDPRAALLEMARVTRDGGTIAAYVWDYAGKMELMRYFWDAAVELDPEAAKLDEGVRFPLCRPEALEKLFFRAGLQGVEVKPIDVPTPFASFQDFWQPFLGGQGPAPGYVMSLDEPARGRLRERIRDRLPMAADGSISLTARAWAVRGGVAR